MTSTAAFPSPTRLLIQKVVPLMSFAPSVCSPLTMRPSLQKARLIPSLGWMRTARFRSQEVSSSAASRMSSLRTASSTINNLAVSAGFISGNDTTWTYTPADDFNGEVTISYAVTDPDGGTTLALTPSMLLRLTTRLSALGEQLTLGGVQEDAPPSRSPNPSSSLVTPIVMETPSPSLADPQQHG